MPQTNLCSATIMICDSILHVIYFKAAWFIACMHSFIHNPPHACTEYLWFDPCTDDQYCYNVILYFIIY